VGPPIKSNKIKLLRQRTNIVTNTATAARDTYTVETTQMVHNSNKNKTDKQKPTNIESHPKAEEKDFCTHSEVSCEGADFLCGALSRRGLDLNKLAYNPCRPGGQLK